jgi:hypothetical protein
MSTGLIGLRENADGTFDFGGNWTACQRIGLRRNIPYHAWFAVDKGHLYRTKHPRSVAAMSQALRDDGIEVARVYILDNSMSPSETLRHQEEGERLARTCKQTSARTRTVQDKFGRTFYMSPVAWSAFKQAGGNSLFPEQRSQGKAYGHQYMREAPKGGRLLRVETPHPPSLLALRAAAEKIVAELGKSMLADALGAWRDAGYPPIGKPPSRWGRTLLSNGDGRCPVPGNERTHNGVRTQVARLVNWHDPQQFSRVAANFTDATYRLGVVENYSGRVPAVRLDEPVKPLNSPKAPNLAVWWQWPDGGRAFQRELAFADPEKTTVG